MKLTLSKLFTEKKLLIIWARHFLLTGLFAAFAFHSFGQIMEPVGKDKRVIFDRDPTSLTTNLPNGDLALLEWEMGEGNIWNISSLTLRVITTKGKTAIIGRFPTVRHDDTTYMPYGLEYLNGKFYSTMITTKYGAALFELAPEGLKLIKDWRHVKDGIRSNEGFFYSPPLSGPFEIGQLPLLTVALGELYFNAPQSVYTDKYDRKMYWYELWKSNGTPEGTVPALDTPLYKEMRLSLKSRFYRASKQETRDGFQAERDFLMVRQFPEWNESFAEGWYFLLKDSFYYLNGGTGFDGKKFGKLAGSDKPFYLRVSDKKILQLSPPEGIIKTLLGDGQGPEIIQDDNSWKWSENESGLSTNEKGDMLALHLDGFLIYQENEGKYIWSESNLLDTIPFSVGVGNFAWVGDRWYIPLVNSRMAIVISVDRYGNEKVERVFDKIRVTSILNNDGYPVVMADVNHEPKFFLLNREQEFDAWPMSVNFGHNWAKVGDRLVVTGLPGGPNEDDLFLLGIGSTVNVLVFNDWDGNGLRESHEPGLVSQKVKIAGSTFITSEEGKAFTRLSTDVLKQSKAEVLFDEDDWTLSSGERELEISESSFQDYTLEIGLVRKINRDALKTHFLEQRSRCRSAKQIVAQLKNTTGDTVRVEVHAVLDALNKVDSTSLGWEVLKEGEYKLKAVLGPEEEIKSKIYTTVGARWTNNPEIRNQFKVRAEYSNSIVFNSETENRSVLGCAYDPNDKTAYPVGVSKSQFLLNTDTSAIRYFIRFQNVGNDTAYNVEILDSLSDNLDPATLKLLDWSHSMRTTITDKGLVSFDFRNIYLPDSNVDEKGSHGYVTFTVKPKANLPHRTLIPNKAGIYFDFNDPVITNTTQTVMVTHIPVDAPQLLKAELADGPKANLTFSSTDPFVQTLDLYRSFGDTLNFNKVHSTQGTQQTWTDKGLVEEGIYYYRLQSINGVEKSAWSQTKSVEYKVDNVRRTSLDGHVHVYPNPAHDRINVELDQENIKGHIQILNGQGKVVAYQTLGPQNSVDISTLPAALYVLRVSTANGQYEQLISIQ